MIPADLGWGLGCTPAPPLEATAVEVRFTFEGLSDRYAGWIGSDDARIELGRALAACADGPVTVGVRYEGGHGWIGVSAPWRDGCLPAADGGLAPVVPIGRAVARWRNGLAARHDPRLAAFTVELHLAPGCDVALFGQYPPDGTTFATCQGGACAGEITARACR